MTLSITRVSGALGAEINNVDLSQKLNRFTILELRQALLRHKVLFFQNQDITPHQHLAFAQKFGDIVEYPMVNGLKEEPQIVPVVKLPHETVNFGGMWHSDTSYTQSPPMGSILVAREIPPFGGDTLFANQALAYERLSKGMKKILKNLIGVSSSAKKEVTQSRQNRMATDAKLKHNNELRAEHPVVRTHPETGEKILYVNYGHTIKFKDMTEQESAPILDYLFKHQSRPEFCCSFRWKVGSIAFWDNRSTQHNPINDYDGYTRVMHRVTIAGDRPV
tara:strand:- start:264 stop:1094 length:831 start_codon:yes stop_codon:yes gene_type:complete